MSQTFRSLVKPLGAMHSEFTEIDIDLTARKPPTMSVFGGKADMARIRCDVR